MKITLDEWLTLEKEAKAAGEALNRLNQRLCDLMLRYRNDGDTIQEHGMIVRLLERVDNAELALSSTLYHVQSEWTGGPSDEPRNFTLREPNWVTISHSFPKEDVDKYRNEDGEIVIPHRQQKHAGTD